MISDALKEEARKWGERQYGDVSFRIYLVPNGNPGKYDAVYETLSLEGDGEEVHYIEDGFRVRVLETLKVKE